MTFNVGIFTSMFAAIGKVLHEFLEGIITFLVLERGGFKRKKAALYAFLATAISTPLGTAISYPFIQRIEHSPLGIPLAISAGTLVYVDASQILTAIERENKQYTIISLTSGILVTTVIVMSKG